MKTTWNIDSTHSSANFSIKHLVIARVYGVFEKITGTLILDLQEPKNSSVEATIETNSINTRNAERDDHVRSVDFLDSEKFPVITYKSTNVSDKKMVGDLTIHGVTKQIVLNIEGPSEESKDKWGNIKIGFSASTEIKLKEFGLTWNAALVAGGLLVGDDVKITLDVQFVRI